MSSWRLPTRLEVGGKAYPIHSDYRDILDILHRLNDASEPEFIRWRVALALFYEGDLPRSDYPEAMQKLADFLNCGQTLPRSPAPPLLDWEQDAPLIAADINKAAGCEVRALRGLRLFGYHGVNPEEKIQGQRFEIDADLYVNLAKACHSDRVEDTVSYAKVIKTLRRVFTERTNDLLERTAEDLTAAVLAEYPEVLRVDLTLKKPQAPIQADFDWVGVTISRDRK